MKHFPHLSWLITALFPLFLSAQSTVFAPVGATWRYNSWAQHGSEGSQQYRYVVTGDTLLNGWNARKMVGEVWQNGVFIPDASISKYVATEGNKVFYYVNGAFVLIFDFGAIPGDTILSKVEPFPIGTGCAGPINTVSFGYVIDSIAVMTLNGETLRVQYVTNLPNQEWLMCGIAAPFSNPIIERIGSVATGTWFGDGNICFPSGFPALLRCYQDSSIFFKGNIGNQDCDYIVGTASPELTQLSIAPNPFSDHITVQLPLGTSALLTIRDVSGRVVLRREIGEGSSVISTSGLRAGMYVWEVEDGARVESGKLVKI